MAGLYEDANKSLIDTIRGGITTTANAASPSSLIPNTSGAINSAPGLVADAYNKGGVGAAFGMGVRQVASIPVGLAQDAYRAGSAAHGAVMDKAITPVAGGISDAVRTAVTGEVRPSQADTTSGRLPLSVLPNSTANLMRGPGPDSPLGASSPLSNFANQPAPRTPGVPLISSLSQQATNGRGSVMSIDMNAANRSLAAANQVRQGYLDSQAAADGGPRGGAISDSGAADSNATLARWGQERMIQRAIDSGNPKVMDGVARLANVGGDRYAVDARIASGERTAAADRAAQQGSEMARLGIDRERLGLDRQQAADRSLIAGLDSQLLGGKVAEQNQRTGLIGQYLAAQTPEQRAQLERSIGAITGNLPQPQNRYTVVPGGQEVDQVTNQLRTVPSRVLNNQTGQFVEQPATATGRQPSQAHIDFLRQNKDNPAAIASFERNFGPGSSKGHLGT